MLSAIIPFFQQAWKFWASQFAPIPYGDPHLAVVCMSVVLLVFGVIGMKVWLLWRCRDESGLERDSLKTYRRVMNL